jgi:hypothetical protein
LHRTHPSENERKSWTWNSPTPQLVVQHFPTTVFRCSDGSNLPRDDCQALKEERYQVVNGRLPEGMVNKENSNKIVFEQYRMALQRSNIPHHARL